MSSSGVSGIEARTMTVAQRETVRTPNKDSASCTDETFRGSEKKALFTYRSSFSESPTSDEMIRSRSSKETSPTASSASRPSAPRPEVATPRCLKVRGWAKYSPWK